MSASRLDLLKAFLLVQALVLALVLPAWAKGFFGIVDYRPSTFIERPTAPFFYSIGNKISFGSVIAEDGPVLFEAKPTDGGLWYVFVAPDQTTAAVVSGGKLYLVQAGHAPVPILGNLYNLRDWYSASWRVDKQVYDYSQMAWDASSRFIYIPRGVWRNGNPSHSALLRIDVTDPANVVEITNDVFGLGIFPVGQDAVCFWRVVNKGDVIWKCARNGIEYVPTAIEENRIVMKDGAMIAGRPFASYRSNIYEDQVWLSRYGFSLQTTPDGYTGFFLRDRPDKPILVIRGSVGNGRYSDGIMQNGCIVLPEGRYALLNVWLNNFQGQLLVDGLTGQYRQLPRDTRVYRNLNTSNYKTVGPGLGGTNRIEFEPIGELRTKVQSLPR